MNSLSGNLPKVDTASVSSPLGFDPANTRQVASTGESRGESPPGELSSGATEFPAGQRARVHLVEDGVASARLSAQLMDEARSRIFRAYREISRMSI